MRRAAFLTAVFYALVLAASCAVFRGSPEQASEPDFGPESFAWTEEKVKAASLEKNLVYTDGVRISLPEGWIAVREERAAETLSLRPVSGSSAGNRPARGRYERVKIGDGYRFEQFLQFYAADRYPEAVNRRLSSVASGALPEDAGGFDRRVFSAEGVDGRYVSILAERNGEVHVIELVFDTSYEHADSAASLLLQGLVRNSPDAEEHMRNARSREGEVSFFPVSSGFRWLSDVDHGIVLEGEIEGFPAVAVLRLEAETEGEAGAPVSKGEKVGVMLRNELIECRAFSMKVEEGLTLVGLKEVPGAGSRAAGTGPEGGGGLFSAELYLDTGGARVDSGAVARSDSLRMLLERELFLERGEQELASGGQK